MAQVTEDLSLSSTTFTPLRVAASAKAGVWLSQKFITASVGWADFLIEKSDGLETSVPKWIFGIGSQPLLPVSQSSCSKLYSFTPTWELSALESKHRMIYNTVFWLIHRDWETRLYAQYEGADLQLG